MARAPGTWGQRPLRPGGPGLEVRAQRSEPQMPGRLCTSRGGPSTRLKPGEQRGGPRTGGYRPQCLSISGFKNKFPVNAKEKQDSFRQESIYQKTIQKSYFMVRHVPKTGNQEVFTGCPGGGQSPPLPTDSSSLICCPKPPLPSGRRPEGPSLGNLTSPRHRHQESVKGMARAQHSTVTA